MTGYATNKTTILLTLAVALAAPAGCGPKQRPATRPSDAGYVPPEPSPAQHDAPPRRPQY